MATYPARFRAHQGSRRGAYIYRVASPSSPLPHPVRREATTVPARIIQLHVQFRRCDDMYAVCCLTQDKSARSTALRFCSRLSVLSYVLALDVNGSESVGVAPRFGRRSRSDTSSVRRRHRSCPLIGHVFSPSPSVALPPRRSPATSPAVLVAPDSRSSYCGLRTSSETTMLLTPASPPDACHPSPHDPLP